MNCEKPTIKSVLIIGKRPLPIGGVTIHVDRLLNYLSANQVQYDYVDLNKSSIIFIIKKIFLASRIHLHSSNVYLRFSLSLFGKLTCKKIDYTLHGDLGRYKSKFKNSLDKTSIKLAYRPILLNKSSWEKAVKLNHNAILGSSFIPPNILNEKLNIEMENSIVKLKNKTEFLFCTNAYNLSRDKDGEEIYGIFELIKLFRELTEYGLIISDPSGSYQLFFEQNNTSIPKNILLISQPHSFFKIIELSNSTIRNTTTDGDSISVKESLYLNKITLCTNIGSRPNGSIIYEKGELKSVLKNIRTVPTEFYNGFKSETKSSLSQLLELYR